MPNNTDHFHHCFKGPFYHLHFHTITIASISKYSFHLFILFHHSYSFLHLRSMHISSISTFFFSRNLKPRCAEIHQVQHFTCIEIFILYRIQTEDTKQHLSPIDTFLVCPILCNGVSCINKRVQITKASPVLFELIQNRLHDITMFQSHVQRRLTETKTKLKKQWNWKSHPIIFQSNFFPNSISHQKTAQIHTFPNSISRQTTIQLHNLNHSITNLFHLNQFEYNHEFQKQIVHKKKRKQNPIHILFASTKLNHTQLRIKK